MTTLVHPQMMAGLAKFYPSSCTMQQRAVGVSAYGRRNGALANVSGLVGIACSVNRVRNTTAPQEVKRSDSTVVTATHIIALAGYYPTITTAMVAVVGSVVYDILSVEQVQDASMELMVERVTT
jgi:hypothetical protein